MFFQFLTGLDIVHMKIREKVSYLCKTLSFYIALVHMVTVGCGTCSYCAETHFGDQFDKVPSGGTLNFNCGKDTRTIKFTTHKWVRHTLAIDGGSKIELDAQGLNRNFILLKEDNSNADGIQAEIKDIKLAKGMGVALEPALSNSDGGCIFVGTYLNRSFHA